MKSFYGKEKLKKTRTSKLGQHFLCICSLVCRVIKVWELYCLSPVLHPFCISTKVTTDWCDKHFSTPLFTSDSRVAPCSLAASAFTPPQQWLGPQIVTRIKPPPRPLIRVSGGNQRSVLWLALSQTFWRHSHMPARFVPVHFQLTCIVTRDQHLADAYNKPAMFCLEPWI